MINEANNATANIIGIIMYEGTFMRLVEMVGILLTIKNETKHNSTEQKVCERTI